MSGETSTIDVEDGECGNRNSGFGKMPSTSMRQWESVVYATIAVDKFMKVKRARENLEVDNPASLEVAPASHGSHVVGPASQDHPALQVENAASKGNLAAKDDCSSGLEYLMVVHKALVEQFNAFGIILTLLVAVTSVAILQPPSSFYEGHISSSKLVACFLMFSAVSFLLACTGLMAVIVGSASLLRPWFINKPCSSQSEALAAIGMTTTEESEAIDKITKVGQGTSNDTDVVFDTIETLGKIILDNLYRVRRLRMYLAFSLGLCMMAFLCGACAILGPQSRNKWMAIGTIIASGFVLVFESIMTLLGPTQSPVWLRKCISLLKGVGELEFSRATSKNVRKTMTRTASMNSGPEKAV